MTMIGFTTSQTKAELITDTCTYRYDLSRMGQGTKFAHLAHLDALVTSTGEGSFGNVVKVLLQAISGDASFDELTRDAAKDLCRIAWGDWVKHDDTTYPSTAFLIGYSESAERFTAWRYDSENDFEPVACNEGLALTPMPLSGRPDPITHARVSKSLQQVVESIGADMSDAEVLLSMWAGKEPLPAPATQQEWRDLAKEVRRSCSVDAVPGMKVIVAGKVIHTRLQRGSCTSSVIHKFNDQGEEFLKMVQGSEHPQAAYGPCICGSGEAFGECCLPYRVPAGAVRAESKPSPA